MSGRHAYGSSSSSATLEQPSAPSPSATSSRYRSTCRYLKWCDRLAVLPGTNGLDNRDQIEALRRIREDYLSSRRSAFRAPDGKLPPELAQEEDEHHSARQDASASNPLGLEEDNPWQRHLASMSAMTQIQADVERTFPDEEAFQSVEVQSALCRILFVFCCPTGPGAETGYRQGMHELAAVCWLVRSRDSIGDQDQSAYHTNADLQSSLASGVRSVECDTYAIFAALMDRVGAWFEWRQDMPSTSTAGPVMPIMVECAKVHQTLGQLDPQLHAHLQNLGIEPQLYLLRWIRLLFTRELPLPDAIKLWDAIFDADPSLKVVPFVCIAMMLRIRRPLLEAAYAEAFTHLLHFPKACLAAKADPSLAEASSSADASIQSRGLAPSLLVQQALALRDTGTQGVELCARQNEVILGLCVRTPDLPAPSAVVQPRTRTRQTPNTVAGGRAAGHRPGLGTDSFVRPLTSPGQAQSNNSPLTASAGLIPDGIADLARGLYSRADALGVNRALVNAMGNVQRTVGAYAAVGAQLAGPGRMSSSQDDGFPPSIDRIPRTAASAGTGPQGATPWTTTRSRDPLTDLQMLRASNAAMGQALSACIDVLERNWSDGDGSSMSANSTRERELTGAEIEVLMSITALKHTRDVLIGTAAEFDPATVAWPEIPTSEPKRSPAGPSSTEALSPQVTPSAGDAALRGEAQPIENATARPERSPNPVHGGAAAPGLPLTGAPQQTETTPVPTRAIHRMSDRSGMLNARAFARPPEQEDYNPLAGFRAAAENSRFSAAAFDAKERSSLSSSSVSPTSGSGGNMMQAASRQGKPGPRTSPESHERRASDAIPSRDFTNDATQRKDSAYPPPPPNPSTPATSPIMGAAHKPDVNQNTEKARKPILSVRKARTVPQQEPSPPISGDPLGAS